ncbi:hypothetical protein IWX49DRAFT_568862 [Phyllosticta citricarpa]|uniref:Transmembrane protein n=1 Tax=Phyllosticta citricarpa TaxID=55181 RepID=A0ABR1MGS7_9PEZI
MSIHLACFHVFPLSGLFFPSTCTSITTSLLFSSRHLLPTHVFPYLPTSFHHLSGTSNTEAARRGEQLGWAGLAKNNYLDGSLVFRSSLFLLGRGSFSCRCSVLFHFQLLLLLLLLLFILHLRLIQFDSMQRRAERGTMKERDKGREVRRAGERFSHLIYPTSSINRFAHVGSSFDFTWDSGWGSGLWGSGFWDSGIQGFRDSFAVCEKDSS